MPLSDDSDLLLNASSGLPLLLSTLDATTLRAVEDDEELHSMLAKLDDSTLQAREKSHSEKK